MRRVGVSRIEPSTAQYSGSPSGSVRWAWSMARSETSALSRQGSIERTMKSSRVAINWLEKAEFASEGEHHRVGRFHAVKRAALGGGEPAQQLRGEVEAHRS